MDYLYNIGEQKIGSEEIVYTKIGITNDPRERLRQLQTSNPRILKILGVRPICLNENREQVESQVHSLFKEIRKSGEWFIEGRELQNWRLKNMLPYEDEILKMSSEEYFFKLGRQIERNRPIRELLAARDLLALHAGLISQARCKHLDYLTKELKGIKCNNCYMHWYPGDTRDFLDSKIANHTKIGFSESEELLKEQENPTPEPDGNTINDVKW